MCCGWTEMLLMILREEEEVKCYRKYTKVSTSLAVLAELQCLSMTEHNQMAQNLEVIEVTILVTMLLLLLLLYTRYIDNKFQQ